MATYRSMSSRYNENANTRANTKIGGDSKFGVKRSALADRTNNTAAPRSYLGAKKARAPLSSRTTTGLSSKPKEEKKPFNAEAELNSTVVPSIVPFATPTREIPHDDIDYEDINDPQACTEYVEEIMHHLREKELQYLAPPTYMSQQADINEKMRAILIDWLVEVHLKFKLLQETLHLTVNIIDRFLAVKQVTRNKLQLVGITAMLVASKYEEIYAPEVRDFIYICDKAYTRPEILRMEQLILNTLGFNLLPPYPLHFLRRFSKASKADLRTHTLAKYLIELTLVDYGCIKFLPSTVAAAALNVAMKMTNCGTWNGTLEHYSHYTESALLPCMSAIVALQNKQEKSSLQAVHKKYSSSKFLEVSKMPPAAI
jgi:cyclin B